MKNLFSKLKSKLRIILAIILIAVIVGGFYFWQIKKGRVLIDDSQIGATIINVAPTTSGRLLEMDAQEGKRVKKGDTIAIVGTETIRSTTDGLVVMVNNQVGGSFTPQNTVAQLIDLSQMRVSGTIDENKGLNSLRVGQVASFTVDAFPRVIGRAHIELCGRPDREAGWCEPKGNGSLHDQPIDIDHGDALHPRRGNI